MKIWFSNTIKHVECEQSNDLKMGVVNSKGIQRWGKKSRNADCTKMEVLKKHKTVKRLKRVNRMQKGYLYWKQSGRPICRQIELLAVKPLASSLGEK